MITSKATSNVRNIASALAGYEAGHMLPWVVREQTSGQIVGTTRYHDIVTSIDRVEIGYTWYARRVQRTPVNTECKLMLLTHAFETLGAISVVFKTETLNTQSRAALLRIGAVEEGTFRQHLVADGGRRRDMVYFAILDREWPDVKARLQARLR